MYKSYFRIGWRNLARNKGYSAINIGGLAAGMTVAILIGLWVYDELSFNKNFPNYPRIARVMQNQVFNGVVETWGSQAMQLGPELRNVYGSNFEHVIMSSFGGSHKLTWQDRSIMKDGNFMEPGITEMLSLKMIRGTRGGLKDLHSILISASTAKALFGAGDPLDKSIRVNDKLDVKVTGVYEDLPVNCDFSGVHVIMPWELLIVTENLAERVGWGNSWFQCFVQLADNVDMRQASAGIRDAKLKRVLAEDDDARFKPELFLHPMSRWRLYSDFKNGVSTGGAIQVVRMFGIVGGFVLLLACINFMNLSTARSEKRAKEVGIRKTIGSVRTQLVNQFLTESLLVTVLAFVLSLISVQLLLPWFNEISNKRIAMLWGSGAFWAAGLGFVLFTGVLAGSYPALYLSSFSPVRVLKGAIRAGRIASVPRKILVVVQFTVSVSLIVGTVVVFRQIQYAQSRPTGYDRSGLLYTQLRTQEIMKHYDAFRNDMLQTGVVREVSASQNPITSTFTTNSGYTWNGKDPAMSEEFVTVSATHEFGKTVNWEIVDGRDFSRSRASDSSAFIVNEAAVKYMGLASPVGEIMKWNNNGEFRIIGVVRDMITQSPYAPVRPMIFFLPSHTTGFARINFVNIRLDPGSPAREAIARIEEVYKKYDPANAFDYSFADVQYARKFANEERIATLAAGFTSLAILISCLGLFGLVAFVAERRTKEIGIRKVLGASIGHLLQLISKDFVVLILISCIIAIPVSYLLMSQWLLNYAYRVPLTWHLFALAGVAALLITMLTVSFQALKAAVASPVDSLRME